MFECRIVLGAIDLIVVGSFALLAMTRYHTFQVTGSQN